MARIAGIDIPPNKVAWVGLSYIYGIGPALARKILREVGIQPTVRIRDLSDEMISRINNIIDKSYTVEGSLRRQVAQNIQRLKDIGSYRGFRHKRGLPVRGQRTRTNARTRKGPRKTVAGKKKVAAKT
jgi:small subunit ribosomal protein S13